MAVFEASPEGFRAQNLGRPAAHLVRELVQNALDEEASVVKVTVAHTPKRGVLVRVEDDVLGGFRDETLVFTIWASDKQDSPKKRGRMGRGLKELVSVSDATRVSTQGRPSTIFERSNVGEWKRWSTTTVAAPFLGTVIEARVGAWSAKDAKEIVAYLRRIRSPESIQLFVNGEVVERKPTLETYDMSLPSVTYVVEDGERKLSNRSFSAKVELFSEETHWVYEMGIPIEEIDFPVSIDVGQRVPLREQRDTLLSWYKSELFAKLVSLRISHLPAESLKDNYILKASESMAYLSGEARAKIAAAWTEGRPYATTPQMMHIATGSHIPVVNLRTLPEAVRAIVKDVGKDVRAVLAERQPEVCEREVLTPSQQILVDCWEWVADGIHRPCSVSVSSGKPSCSASYQRETARLTLFRENLKPDFFGAPFKADQLSVLIHELSHWRALEDAHGADFHSDAEHVGAEIAVFLMENYYEASMKALRG